MRTRDQAIAEDTQDPVDVVGRCKAQDCPNIWTTESSRLCRWHSASPPHAWAAISEELQMAVTDRALERQNAAPAPKMSTEQKRQILAKLRGLFTRTPEDPKAWAHALKAREEGGERLSLAQKTMWRAALRHHQQGEPE